MKDGLKTLWDARDQIPQSRKNEFLDMLLGALSASCPTDIWEDTIRLVKETILREEK